MQRLLHLHPLSLAVGGALALLLLVTMGQTPVDCGPVRLEYLPHPRDMVQIKEGTPYVVPANKIFVLTGLGLAGSGGGPGSSLEAHLLLNGNLEVSSTGHFIAVQNQNSAAPSSPSIVQVPPGFTAGAGAMLEASGGGSPGNDARAWGYLANL